MTNFFGGKKICFITRLITSRKMPTGLGAGAGRQIRSELATSCGADPERKPRLSPPSRSARGVAGLKRAKLGRTWCGAVALHRPLARDRARLWGQARRALGRRFVRRLSFRRMSVRPRCPDQAAAAQEALKKIFRSGRCLHPRHAQSKPIEIPCRQAGATVTRIWAQRGSRPRAPRDQRYAGLVCSAPSPHAMPAPRLSCRWP